MNPTCESDTATGFEGAVARLHLACEETPPSDVPESLGTGYGTWPATGPCGTTLEFDFGTS